MTENPPGGDDRQDGAPDPASVDPEQWRQFQEYRRFQEYLRFTESRAETRNTELATWQPTQVPVPDQPRSPVPYQQRGGDPEPPTPPHGQRVLPQPQDQAQPGLQQQLTGMQQQLTEITEAQRAAERRANPPLWRKILRSKWVRSLVVLLVLLAAGSWALNSLFDDGSDEQTKEQQLKPGTTAERRLVQGVDGPRQAVRSVYQFAANAGTARQQNQQRDADRIASLACNNIFLPEGAREFAANRNAPDCVAAMQGIEMSDPDSYGRPRLLELPDQPEGSTQRLDSCSFPVTGGPRLGAFTMRLQSSGTWAVAAHENTSCPTPPSNSNNPPR